MSYIDRYSWRCLLGKQSRNIREINDIYFWEVGKTKKHFCTNKILTPQDIPLLLDHSFHYLSEDNANFLKQYYKIQRGKNLSTLIDLSQLSLEGGERKKLRQSINKIKKLNLTIQDNFNHIDDVKGLIEEWSNVLAQKYFRDHSGKNTYFYQNNFHQGCINAFIYDQDKLIAFATASPQQPASYIIGKALCHRYAGLSEYADYVLYLKLLENNITLIDLGQTEGGLVQYKGKWPGATTYNFYNGKVLNAI